MISINSELEKKLRAEELCRGRETNYRSLENSFLKVEREFLIFVVCFIIPKKDYLVEIISEDLYAIPKMSVPYYRIWS